MSLENKFFVYAMKLFFNSGYVDSINPIFKNHSSKAFFYSDNHKNVVFSNKQRQLFNDVTNISYLFSLGNDSFDKRGGLISFFSIVINSFRSDRSQIAYDFHNLLHSILDVNASIIIFLHEEEVMITAKGYGTDVYLSDWYAAKDINGPLLDLLDISNFSLRSAKEYYSDFIYDVSRWYYFHSISKDSIKFEDLSNDETDFSDEDPDKRYSEIRNIPEEEYGDDYVDQRSFNHSSEEAKIDFDILFFEYEIEESNENNTQTNSDDLENSGKEKDKYDFEDIDKKIFRDPLLMIKHINKSIHVQDSDELDN